MEWFGTLPERWETRKVNELFSERREKVSDKDFAPLSVSKGGIVPQISTVAKTNAGDNRKLVRQGDFVINSRSDRRGSSGVSLYDGSVSLINIVLTPREKTNGRYWHYLLKSHNFIEEYYRNGRGIVADLWTTRYTEMKTIYLSLPPREEQDQIARFLDWKVRRINKLINAKRRQIELLQEQKQTVINATINNTNANSVLCRYLGRFQNGISESGDFFTDGFPFVNYGDVYNNIALPETVSGKAKSSEKQQNTYSVEEGDIFFTRTSETIDEVGLTSVCFKTIKKAVFSGFVIRMRPKKNLLNNTYAKYYFRSQRVRDYFVKEMNLVTRASLGQTLLKNLPVLLPSMEEQRAVGERLDIQCEKIDRLISAIQKQISFFHEYRTRLISDVVMGKVDVRGVVVAEHESIEESTDYIDNTEEETNGID
jgi:type I restriction enzyme S subunit